MKELWLEATATGDENEKLLRQAAQICDATVVGDQATLANGEGKVTILEGFNPQTITKLKGEGKQVALRVAIQGKQDENQAVEAAELGADYIIIDCLDWRVIPLENLIAKTHGKSKLLAQVSNAEDARLVLEALELGTDGVLLKTSDPEELAKTADHVKHQTPKFELTHAKVLSTKPIGTGARVCVDTCDLMEQGEGILVGSQSAGLFLVEAEVHENPYVAGSLQNTRYLSEFKAGDEVVIVNREGKVRKANVGRTKTEFRPLILVEAEVEGKTIKIILQNAETIRLVTPKGSKPVTELKPGDEVVVHLAAKGGRHFGVSVPDEKVIER
jgi:3-dehydroquinate synthase II